MNLGVERPKSKLYFYPHAVSLKNGIQGIVGSYLALSELLEHAQGI